MLEEVDEHISRRWDTYFLGIANEEEAPMFYNDHLTNLCLLWLLPNKKFTIVKLSFLFGIDDHVEVVVAW